MSVKYATAMKHDQKVDSSGSEGYKHCVSCSLLIPKNAGSCFACGTDQRNRLIAFFQRWTPVGLILATLGVGVSVYSAVQANRDRVSAEKALARAEQASEDARKNRDLSERLIHEQTKLLELSQELGIAAQVENVSILDVTHQTICRNPTNSPDCELLSGRLYSNLENSLKDSISAGISEARNGYCNVYGALKKSYSEHHIYSDQNMDKMFSDACGD